MGCGSGTIFWLITLRWLLQLSETGAVPLPFPLIGLGLVLLSVYLGFYQGVFCRLITMGLVRWGVRDWTLNIMTVLILPLVWVGLEYLRSSLFYGGFPWCQVGVSQYTNTMIIQCAEWGGVYAVSYVILCMNAAVALVVLRRIELYRHKGRSRFHPELMVGLSVFAFVAMSGQAKLGAFAAQPMQETIRVTAVEPGIRQGDKWDDAVAEETYAILSRRTLEAALPTNPDLVIWPETAIPHIVDDLPARLFLRDMSKLRYPILFGAMEVRGREGDSVLLNSSFLLTPGEGLSEGYAKRHLVPFGEFLPFSKLIRSLGFESPMGFDCTPGDTNSVFILSAKNVAFSPLICFEDTVPWLSREAVANGARMLVVQTNDAWFEGTALFEQHMSHSIFRAIENRVPLVRVGNTGISCGVDATGRFRFTDQPPASDGEASPDTDIHYWDVVPAPTDLKPTLYRLTGDVAYAGVGWLSMLVFVLALFQDRLKNRTEPNGGHSAAPLAGEDSG